MSKEIHYVVSPLYPDDWPDLHPIHIHAPTRQQAVEQAVKNWLAYQGFHWSEPDLPALPEIYGVVRFADIKNYSLGITTLTTNSFVVEKD